MPQPSPTRADEADTALADPFGAYLRRIGTVDLLTAADEVRLAFTIEAGVLATARLAAGVRDSVLRDELRILAREGEQARLHMVQANLRLVVSLARRMTPSGTPLFDHVQDGTLGLIHAVRKFDYRRGCKFSTYATWWIRQAITRGMTDAERTVRLPVHVATRLHTCLALRQQLTVEWGREPTVPELAMAVGIAPGQLASLLDVPHDPVSLEAAIEANPAGEQVPDRDAPDPGELAAATVVREQVRAALGSLSPLEREILSRRFGLRGSPSDRKVVAAELDIGYERLRRLEREALASLRADPSLAALSGRSCQPLAG
ncbi:MAG TPA: sigma-70 family RNA polymerase sigma factor [Nocardioidaceae bacterium]|nr:sigma-70 family RNA polymerase sigma factor [Nocardioidaceae bacterium]